MNIQIKSRFTAAVFFEHDTENNSIRMTLELAIKSGADLSGANLYGANHDNCTTWPTGFTPTGRTQ